MRISHLRFAIPLALIGICLELASPLAGQNKKQQEAEALLAKARELSDIRCEGCPPFRLTARLRAWNFKGKPADGYYDLIRCSARKWREEITFQDFSQLRIGGDGTVWLKRSAEFQPLQISALGQLLDLRRTLIVKRDESIGRVKEEASALLSLTCIELEREGNVSRNLCFDEEAGTLVGEETPTGRFDYAEYRTWEGKTFPGVMRASRKESERRRGRGKPIVDLQIENLGPGNCEDTAMFTPPDAAVEQPSCESPAPPQIIDIKRPVYPSNLRVMRVEGVVYVYGLIGTDGRFHNLRVLRSPHRDLGAATLRSLSGWQYRPAMCKDVPVATETVVEFSFNLNE